MNTRPKPKAITANVFIADGSDRSTECGSPSPEFQTSKADEILPPSQLQMLIDSHKDSASGRIKFPSCEILPPKRKLTEAEDPDKAIEKPWERKKNSLKPMKHNSNPNIENFRQTIKTSLFKNVREEKMHDFSGTETPGGQGNISECSLHIGSKASITDVDESSSRNDERFLSNNNMDHVLDIHDKKPNKIFQIKELAIDENQSESPKNQPIKHHSLKHPVFYSDMDRDIEDLKIELNVMNEPNIQFLKGNFTEFYKEGEILGEGTTGTVKKCLDLQTREIFAVKIVAYRGDTEMLHSLTREFKYHGKLNHKNIIKVYKLYIDYFIKKIYMVMELAECREMLEVIQGLGHYSEAVASGIFKQILAGINYLHQNGVCHRDLKPNNILVSNDGKIVKITDFNVSKFIEDRTKKYSSLSKENFKMWTYTGTIAFTAPEVFQEIEYTEAIDMWSAGAVLYTMLCGYQPFFGDTNKEVIDKILAADYDLKEESWQTVSKEAISLVVGCLNLDPKARFLPFDALKHEWITNQGKVPDRLMVKVKDNLLSTPQLRPRGETSSKTLSPNPILSKFTSTGPRRNSVGVRDRISAFNNTRDSVRQREKFPSNLFFPADQHFDELISEEEESPQIKKHSFLKHLKSIDLSSQDLSATETNKLKLRLKICVQQDEFRDSNSSNCSSRPSPRVEENHNDSQNL